MSIMCYAKSPLPLPPVCRHVVPNFYYWMQDYLEARVAGGAPWAWSSVRPNPVCGYSASSAMNLVTRRVIDLS